MLNTDKLEAIKHRQEEILAELAMPNVEGDRLTTLLKEQAVLSPIVENYDAFLNAEAEAAASRELLQAETDPEMRRLIEEEIETLAETIAAREQTLRILLLPKDPNDQRNAIVEIRAGAGGDEAALFAAEIYRMYVHYADRQRWKTELISLSENGIGGFKEVVFRIEGTGVFERLKYESGTHRVQRVPETESGGRIHTSTVTVAVLPEAEEVDVEIDPNDCHFDVYRSTGHGGQSVNTTDSAVRLVHKPTGIVVTCQDEKSQLKNKEKAMQVLRTRLYDMKRREEQEKRADLRRGQIGTGDRSEKIRTYNFGQTRVTDHRIHLTSHKLEGILGGDLDELIDALLREERAQQLASEAEG